uniref:Uncharacterized protein n=1 Tax=Soybean thrips virus 3 TaxID=2796557 RepID=A0A7T3R0N9_9VIRU|nr:hypothetical protein [Soybean thrips virus 3]
MEIIENIYYQLSTGPGVALCDENFISLVLPIFVEKLVDCFIKFGLFRNVALYVLALNFAFNWLTGQLLGRIWLPLAYAFHLYCIGSCYHTGRITCFGMISVLLLLRELLFGYRNAKNEVVPVTRYSPVVRTSHWNIDLIMVLGVVMIAMGWVAELYGQPGGVMYSCAMILFFYSFTVNAPNAGGNSVWANIPYFMIFLLVLLLLEPVRNYLAATLEERGALNEAVRIRQQEFNSAHTFVTLIKDMDFTSRYFTTTGGLGFVKSIVGTILNVYIVIDTLLGPGYMMRGLARVERLGITSFSAGVYSAPLPYVLLAELVMHGITGSWEKIASISIAAVLAALIWFWLAPPVWETKGVAATVTRVRTNFLMYWGDGPAGLRKAVLRSAVFICWIVDSYRDGIQLWSSGAFVMSIFSEKTAILMLGHLSGNMVMIAYNIFRGDYLEGDITMGAPGVQRGEAGNVGGGEAAVVGANADYGVEDWIPMPDHWSALTLIDKANVISDRILDATTMRKLREWSIRTGGTYRVLTKEKELDDEDCLEMDADKQPEPGVNIVRKSVKRKILGGKRCEEVVAKKPGKSTNGVVTNKLGC